MKCLNSLRLIMLSSTKSNVGDDWSVVGVVGDWRALVVDFLISFSAGCWLVKPEFDGEPLMPSVTSSARNGDGFASDGKGNSLAFSTTALGVADSIALRALS